jgi:1-acyl-sn-glycerol-3-phosphate acyltransferase
MAKAEAMRWPILGPLFRAYGGFGVERGRLDREAYRTARAVLDSDDWLGLAPEGTRSRTGALGEAHTGAVLLAIRSGATILPIALAGTERVWPVGAAVPRPWTRATVRIGEPYRPATRDAEAETKELMRRIAALLPRAYRGRLG